ncbi:MAG TPA: ABC transporter substrate-binding protein [Candidatus Egerieimonas intestinavium]|uniref:ABC transporter substrate-binding protein n=1 Tax=Candidatus Egerieimonas intestinavium TaxID=2840777 RepID=A0A9D1EHR3_9FIRM|nr:ABC transporter substrate-binding protein [Candidatus Egerieimonas intestinavium]
MKSKSMKRFLALALAGALALTAAGCGGSDGNNSGDSGRKDAQDIVEDNKAEATETPAAEDDAENQDSAKKTEYPLTITTYNSDGTQLETTYEKAPEKVVAVYQGSIETMLALGLEDHLVATAGLDNEVPDEQKAAFSETNYLDEFTPSKETVTMLEPDMIFSWGSLFGEKTLGNASEWVEKGVNTYMNTNTHPKQGDASYNKTLENEYNDILNIGKIFDVQDKAEAIVNEMETTIDMVLEKTSAIQEKPTVLILESGKDSFTNYNATSLGGDMVTQLGGVLANPDGASLGKEDVIAANPDVIFVVYMPYTGDDPEEVKQEKLNVILEDEAYASLDAVKNGRVVPIMLSEMYASATRTQDGIVTFAQGLYPDVDLGI